jgi:hypothetical protein
MKAQQDESTAVRCAGIVVRKSWRDRAGVILNTLLTRGDRLLNTALGFTGFGSPTAERWDRSIDTQHAVLIRSPQKGFFAERIQPKAVY